MYNMLLFGYKINTMLVVLLTIAIVVIFTSSVCGTCDVPGIIEGLENAVTSDSGKEKKKEGYTNLGDSASYSLANYSPQDTSSWATPDLTLTRGKQPSAGAKSIMNRPAQQIPLPEGEMLMFANTEFKPECCPNTYSTGNGCACMTPAQYGHLVSRGGNNVPYSEY
jgi:hypothetical protein